MNSAETENEIARQIRQAWFDATKYPATFRYGDRFPVTLIVNGVTQHFNLFKRSKDDVYYIEHLGYQEIKSWNGSLLSSNKVMIVYKLPRNGRLVAHTTYPLR